MDITCPVCSEPTDVDALHDADGPYDQARDTFFTQGCGMAFDGIKCKPNRSLASAVSEAMYDLMGDDVDGIASMMEDFGF